MLDSKRLNATKQIPNNLINKFKSSNTAIYLWPSSRQRREFGNSNSADVPPLDLLSIYYFANFFGLQE